MSCKVTVCAIFLLTETACTLLTEGLTDIANCLTWLCACAHNSHDKHYTKALFLQQCELNVKTLLGLLVEVGVTYQKCVFGTFH